MAAAAADLVEQLGISEIVVSMETIKPSSPTPPELRTHTLSWIDQAMVPTHIGVVLFYLQGGGGGGGDGFAGAPGDTISERLRLLKQSLSHALSLYYVLAGRIASGASGAVNCTDEGIDFIDARVGCPLSAVLVTTKNPAESGTVVDLFLPCGRRCTKGGAGGPLLIVKATTFSCGGMALGLCLLHTVADGQSLAFFLQTWASIARGAPPDVEVGMPALEAAAAAFPLLGTLPSYPPAAGKPQMVRKRFVLDGSKICALREQSTNRALTRMEAVTALLWRSLIRSYSSAAAAAGVGGAASAATEFVACHDVGLRARMRPPLPETSFGNLLMWVAAFVPRHPVDLPLTDQVVTADSSNSSSSTTLRRLTEEQISAAIRGMDDAYIRDTLQSPEGPSAFDNRLGERLTQAAPVTWFSSWWGFPFYEADFGWGKPAWVACGGLDDVPTETQVVLMGRREAGGHMEAWVWSGAEEMAKLDNDPELLSLFSSDPPPHIP